MDQNKSGLSELQVQEQYLASELARVRQLIADRQKKVVNILVLLDRSASMSSLTSDTIGGFNKYVKEQQADNSTDVNLSLLQFAEPHIFQWTCTNQPISKVQPLSTETYHPTGHSTALRDALVHLLTPLREKAKANETYLVVVITDGQDNRSSTTTETMQALIKEFEAKGNFTFAYLGSHADTWTEAASYGYSVGSTYSFTNSSAGVAASYDTLNNSTRAYRHSVQEKGMRSTTDFFNPDTDTSVGSSTTNSTSGT